MLKLSLNVGPVDRINGSHTPRRMRMMLPSNWAKKINELRWQLLSETHTNVNKRILKITITMLKHSNHFSYVPTLWSITGHKEYCRWKDVHRVYAGSLQVLRLKKEIERACTHWLHCCCLLSVLSSPDSTSVSSMHLSCSSSLPSLIFLVSFCVFLSCR